MTSTLTPFQQLALFRDATGTQVRLRRYDTVDAVQITDSVASVLVTRYRIREGSREDRLTHRGQYLLTVNLATGQHREMTVWEPDFQPIIVRHYGRVITPSEYYERRDWEALCYRPGTDDRLGGRDSVARAEQAASDRLDSLIYAQSTTTPAREA